jgi:hypothetical protein
MRYIEAPNSDDSGKQSLFLAGSITGCPDWQKEVVKNIDASGIDMVVFNPRRANFPIQDPNAAFEQIKWEFDHLRKADVISFWFSKDSMGPIVLFELGAHSMTSKPIIVGVEDGYPRQQDVEIQMKLLRPDMKIHRSLGDLFQEIIERFAIRHAMCIAKST